MKLSVDDYIYFPHGLGTLVGKICQQPHTLKGIALHIYIHSHTHFQGYWENFCPLLFFLCFFPSFYLLSMFFSTHTHTHTMCVCVCKHMYIYMLFQEHWVDLMCVRMHLIPDIDMFFKCVSIFVHACVVSFCLILVEIYEFFFF